MRETWTFHSAGTLLFGCDACNQLGEVAARLGARRLLIVTDPILIQAGVLERVRLPLSDARRPFGVRRVGGSRSVSIGRAAPK